MFLLRLPMILFVTAAVVGCYAAAVSAATLLPPDEVEALKEIGKTLGQRDWNDSADPCSIEGKGWFPRSGGVQNASINCGTSSFPDDTAVHVVHIILKGMGLPGRLPPASQLLKLPYLIDIDLTRNFLYGTIPTDWGSLSLTHISLLGNRLTGPIPKELGNLSTLVEFAADANQLSGLLPPELGNLPRIEIMLLGSNNFSGALPVTLAQLTTLKKFRISDNNFTGKMPEFIRNWTSLEFLEMQASGLEGPIPSAISSLDNLKDLRISDFNGTAEAFPDLRNLTNLITLILRSCNLSGPLPPYLGNMANLDVLDLSFNNLSEDIPEPYEKLASTLDFMYLTRNILTGNVPNWIMTPAKTTIDISYNNFTFTEKEPSGCQEQNLNLFKSSSEKNNLGIACLPDNQCPKYFHSFHINCGGPEVKNVKYGTTAFDYDADDDGGGASRLYQRTGRYYWASSNTGHFLDKQASRYAYIRKDNSGLSIENSELYANARTSPISLTYFGFCLANGDYTVRLHFAEIMFDDDSTYRSLGRRIFDVYIQGERRSKDFNIEDAAGGFGKAFVMNLSASVTDNTLEIRFQWAGKGTTVIPDRGVYGPLISAISVFDGDSSSRASGISTGTLVGIILAVAFILFLFVANLCWKYIRSYRNRRDQDLSGLELQIGSFSLRQIKAATNNFDIANKVGEGGFGSVYKGILSDGTLIAVKQLSSKSKQGNREFVNEIGMISALQNPYLVKLYGCCIEGNQMLLVYEYMENNNLARALFGPEEFQLQLDWPTRHMICVGIAKGLAFLHEESRLKIVHRDIKATNILLDRDLNPKISDFGLAKLDEIDNTHISTRIAGTYGYIAPEYATRGYLTDKADVYSFGIVVLEIVSGRTNTASKTKEDSFHLLDWAHFLKKKGDLIELVDSRIGSNFNREEVMTVIEVALLCTNATAGLRPAMSSVVSMLDGRAIVPELPLDSLAADNETKFKAMKDTLGSSLGREQEISESQTQSLTMTMKESSSMDSSTPGADLYPITLGSSYLEERS